MRITRIAIALMLPFVATAATPSRAQSLPPNVTVPSSLPQHFAIGVQAHPSSEGIYGWMPSSGVPWDYAYQYLAGGANTGSGWATWNSNGTFVTNYSRGASQNGYIPTFPYYMNLQSTGPCNSCAENERDLANLNTAAVMQSYFNDFILLMKRLGPGTWDGVAGFGRAAIVHVEPDLHGYAQHAVIDNGNCFGHCTGEGNDPAHLRVAVASSAVAEVAGLPDTYVGFNLALLHIRDLYAPNVLLAWHLSNWATLYDVGSSTDPGLDVAALGRLAGDFANRCGVAKLRPDISRYDLVFNDVADRDAGFYKYVYGRQNAFWDRSNVVLPNFMRWQTYVDHFVRTTGRPVIVWQIPLGNQVYRSMNNSWGHYQDNRGEYFFANAGALVSIGVIGLQFGAGNSGSTVQWDGEGDGVTNPASFCTTDGVSSGQLCNTQSSAVTDDDGGYIRLAAADYYRHPIQFTGGGGNRPPVADAGEDQRVATGVAVSLDGSGSSDPDNDPLTWQWAQTGGIPVSLAGATTARAGFTAPTEAAELDFQLSIGDGSHTVTDAVHVTVEGGSGGGDGPVIASVTSRSGKPGTAARINGSGFGSSAKAVRAYFGGRSARLLKVSATSIRATIPRKLRSRSTVEVYVLVKGVRSNSVSFTLR